MSLNRVVITGNLGADPEIRRTQSGTALLSMRVAVNDRRKNPQTGEWGDYTNWVSAVVLGSRAESLANMLRKGSKIGVDGKLCYSEWDDRNGNGKRSKLEIIADDIELLSPKPQSQPQYPQAPRYPQGGYAPQQLPPMDEDIPF